MRQRYKLVVGALAICVVLSACGFSQPAAKPRYPVVPLPPDATNIATLRPNEDEKVTTFVTSAAPEVVYQFYRDTLPQHGWEIGQEYENGTRFKYLNGANNPAFGLGVLVTQRDETTQVLLRQVISGPFQWNEP